MKISVVIPAYNAEQMIARAIDSVLAQTRPADEIIVVDDGSTDNTAKVIKSYGDKVMLIQQENAGVSVARNTGIEAATGDWIAFLDGDDEWLPEKLKLQTEHLKRNPDLKWTTGNYDACDCQNDHSRRQSMSAESIRRCQEELNGKEVFGDYFNAYRLLAKGHTDTMIIRRDLLTEAGLFLPGQKRMNDIDMWFRIALIEPRIGFLFEPLAVYHLHVPGSIVKTHVDWRLIDEFLQRHLALSEKAGRSEAFQPCARIVFTAWLRPLLYDRQGTGVRTLIRRYGDFLTPSYRRSCYLGSFCPPLWTLKEKVKRKLRSKSGATT